MTNSQALATRFFDLKWRNYRGIPFETLQRHQVVNHFRGARELARKAVLSRELARSGCAFYPHSLVVTGPASARAFAGARGCRRHRPAAQALDPRSTHSPPPSCPSSAAALAARARELLADAGDGFVRCDGATVSAIEAVCAGEPAGREALRLAAADLLHRCSKAPAATERGERVPCGDARIVRCTAALAPLAAPLGEPEAAWIVKQDDLARGEGAWRSHGARRCVPSSTSVQRVSPCATGITVCSTALHAAQVVAATGRPSSSTAAAADGQGEESSTASPAEPGAFVVQRYVSRPLLVHARKFDIRQWVLVTSVEPLVAWAFGQPYLRFCATPYSADPARVSDRCVCARSSLLRPPCARF